MNRRGFIFGLTGVFAAPALVRAASLMPVKVLPLPGYIPLDGRLLSRKLYPELFSKLGEMHGAGDGKTTFRVPDWRDTAASELGGAFVVASKNDRGWLAGTVLYRQQIEGRPAVAAAKNSWIVSRSPQPLDICDFLAARGLLVHLMRDERP